MRAVVLNDARRLEVREVPDPEPADGSVVVRVAGCGICGSDLHMVEAGLMPPGTIMGHEVSGMVESVGPGVEGFAAGDPVAVYPFQPCGTCAECASGITQRCGTALATTLGLGLRPGGFAEYLEASPSMLVGLPPELPLEAASLAEPLAVALHGFRRTGFEPGMTVGVIGCGPIGLCGVLVARALGAGHLWARDPNGFRAELAERLGAEATRAAPREADLVLECAGAPGTLDLAVGSARGGGRVALLAVNMTGDTVHPVGWIPKEIDVFSCLAYTRAEYDEAVAMIASGRVDVTALVTRRVGLEQADDAFFALLEGAPEGKVLLIPG